MIFKIANVCHGSQNKIRCIKPAPSHCVVVSIKQIKIESDTKNTPRSIGKRLIEFDPFLNVHSERSSR